MDLKKLGDVPKSYVKEILNSLSKLDKLKKVPFFTGIHFKDTEDDVLTAHSRWMVTPHGFKGFD